MIYSNLVFSKDFECSKLIFSPHFCPRAIFSECKNFSPQICFAQGIWGPEVSQFFGKFFFCLCLCAAILNFFLKFFNFFEKTFLNTVSLQNFMFLAQLHKELLRFLVLVCKMLVCVLHKFQSPISFERK